MLTVIIPTLNASESLSRCLSALKTDDVIISDGGSQDGTLLMAAKAGAKLCVGSKGRGTQLARGAKFAALKGTDWYLFLHSDSCLPENWRELINAHIASHPNKVGYFKYAQQADGFWPWLQAKLVALRCWAWRLPYGDQALLISRDIYEHIGGFADMPLFEDVDIMNRLKSMIGRNRIKSLPASIRTDISSYERDGWLKRGWRNFLLLRRFQRGASLENLMKTYYDA